MSQVCTSLEFTNQFPREWSPFLKSIKTKMNDLSFVLQLYFAEFSLTDQSATLFSAGPSFCSNSSHLLPMDSEQGRNVQRQ